MNKLLALALALPLATTAVGAQAADWNGPYAGASLSSFSGNVYWYTSTDEYPFDVESGDAISAFAGYRIDTGTLVYGAELSASADSNMATPGYHGVPYGLDTSVIIDAKVTVGYDLGSALVYAVAGYTQMVMEDVIDFPGNPGTLSGAVFGAGVDYMVTDSMFVGLEYLVRAVSLDDFYGPNSGMGYDTGAIQVRAGINF